MASYCLQCANAFGYPKSSVRTSRDPCDFCKNDPVRKGFDPGRKDNYSYPDHMLPTGTGYIKGEEDVDE